MSAITLDATTTVASFSYDTNGELTDVTYPFGTLGGLVKYPSGASKGDTWTVSGRTFSEQITRSQSGRVTGATWADSAGAGSGIGWAYTYDPVGRLTKAVLAGITNGRPQVTFGYAFDKTGGCGVDPAAGANGSRTGSTVQIDTGTIASTSYCYDYASRLTSVTGANPISTITYDGHGNATQIGDQTWTYDAADRVTGTTSTKDAVIETLSYTRDTTGRVVKRVATGPDAGTSRYGFTAADDTPDYQLDPTGVITERYLSLPGGVLLTKPYVETPTTYSIPNWHGDTTAQASITGTTVTVTGAGWVSDPYGQPLNPTTGLVDLAATPTTRTGTSTTDAWLGQHQRGYEHSAGLNQILMGARTYLPALGLFTSIDPVPGGSATTYDYSNQDPVNQQDLTGTFGTGIFAAIWDTAKLGLSVAALFGCVGCGVAALAMSGLDFVIAATQHDKVGMLTNAIDLIPVVGKLGLLAKAEKGFSMARNAKTIWKGMSSAQRAAAGSVGKLRRAYHTSGVRWQNRAARFGYRAVYPVLGASYVSYRRTYGGARD